MSVLSRSIGIGQLARRGGMIAIIVMVDSAAVAQHAVTGVANAVQGFSENRDQPVRIEAGVLEMRDKKKLATFSGHVRVVQGDTTMTSATLVAFYDSRPTTAPAGNAAAKSPPIRSATPGPNGSSAIHRLEARDNVRVTHRDQVVTGRIAVFDTEKNLITVRGGVVLTQCLNVLRGDRLLVDMTTGVSRLESDSGKVQALLPGSGAGCGSSSGSGAPIKPK